MGAPLPRFLIDQLRFGDEVDGPMTDVDRGPSRPGSGSMLPALLIAAFAFLSGGVAFYSAPATGEMAVIFPPSTSEQAAYAAIVGAGGKFVSGTKFDNIAVAYAEDPAFAQRVQALGGLLVLAARGLCAPTTDPPEYVI